MAMHYSTKFNLRRNFCQRDVVPIRAPTTYFYLCTKVKMSGYLLKSLVLEFYMSYHLFLDYGGFLQNHGKDFI